MKYEYRFILYLVLLAITLLVAILCGVLLPKDIETPENGAEATQNANECYVVAPNIPYYPEIYTLASLDNEWLINCLIRYESNGNEMAINPCDVDGRPKYGLLQFDTRTFKSYCVDRYDLPNDIFNGDIQKICCSNMISEGKAYHWGTLNYCIN